jgi:phytoene dehydrogenase-like protein
VLRAIERFEHDPATFKVDWTLDGPVPWASAEARRAGVVHVADSVDELSVTQSEIARRLVPSRPFLVVGQYSAADPTRMPEGKEVAWAYTHIPQRVRGDAGPDGLTGRWDAAETERFVERMEAQVEKVAPGFRGLIRGRHVMAPGDLERQDENLISGALNGGTAQLHQQLFLRPIPGLGRAEMPVDGLYLAGSSAHPGGGVHGAPGANAARALLVHRRLSPGALAHRLRR